MLGWTNIPLLFACFKGGFGRLERLLSHTLPPFIQLLWSSQDSGTTRNEMYAAHGLFSLQQVTAWEAHHKVNIPYLETAFGMNELCSIKRNQSDGAAFITQPTIIFHSWDTALWSSTVSRLVTWLPRSCACCQHHTRVHCCGCLAPERGNKNKNIPTDSVSFLHLCKIRN